MIVKVYNNLVKFLWHSFFSVVSTEDSKCNLLDLVSGHWSVQRLFADFGGGGACMLYGCYPQRFWFR